MLKMFTVLVVKTRTGRKIVDIIIERKELINNSLQHLIKLFSASQNVTILQYS